MTDRFDIYARFYDPDLGEWDDDVQMYEQYAARCGSPILELGCGTGRVLLPLARQGYRLTGIDASAKMLERARAIDDAVHGPDHPSVARDVSNLGSVLYDLGDLAGARAAYERALAIFEAMLGVDHPNTRIVRGNLASLGD